MTKYATGRSYEYATRKKLEKRGYIAVRSAGSHTPFDLVGWNGIGMVLVQCKVSKSGGWRDSNIKLFETVLCPPHTRKLVFVKIAPRKEIVYEFNTGYKQWVVTRF